MQNDTQFLIYGSDRLLLQRIGGRYRFIHKTLQDHFAAMPFERSASHFCHAEGSDRGRKHLDDGRSSAILTRRYAQDDKPFYKSGMLPIIHWEKTVANCHQPITKLERRLKR